MQGHGRVLPTGLLLILAPHGLLRLFTSITCPGVVLLTMSQALPHGSLIKKMSYEHAYSQSYEDLIYYGSHLSSDSSVCRLDIKLARIDTYRKSISKKIIMRLQCKTLVNSISYISHLQFHCVEQMLPDHMGWAVTICFTLIPLVQSSTNSHQ